MKRFMLFFMFAAFLLPAFWTDVSAQITKVEIRNLRATADQRMRTVQISWWAVGDATFVSQVIEFSQDGISFIPIGELPVTPGVNGDNYRFIHTNPVVGINYYRLNMLFTDGSNVYSVMVRAKLLGTRT